VHAASVAARSPTASGTLFVTSFATAAARSEIPSAPDVPSAASGFPDLTHASGDPTVGFDSEGGGWQP
jgi:hypothetical protein